VPDVRVGVLVAVVVSFLVLGISPRCAVADDQASVELGRAIGRAILILRNPYGCAPVLRAPVCLADLRAFVGAGDGNQRLAVPGAAPKPYDRLQAFIVDGDRADLDPALSWLNSMAVAPTDPPRDGQLQDAGISATLYAAAAGNMQYQLMSSTSTLAAAKIVPPLDADLMAPDQRAAFAALGESTSARGHEITAKQEQLTDIMAANAAFAKNVDRKYPAHASPDLDYPPTPHGFVRLGLAFTTAGEYVELPQLAALAESQAFLNGVFDRVAELAPETAPDLATARASLQSSDPSTRRAAFQTLSGVSRALFAHLPRPAVGQFAYGVFIAQMGYNAAVYRDASFVEHLPALMAKVPPLDGVTPADSARIAAISACVSTDFPCQRHASAAAVAGFLAP
jgi:hypothetical protein